MSEKEFIHRPWQVREGYKKTTKDVAENKDEIISELIESLEEVTKELHEMSKDERDEPSVGIFGWNDINERIIPNAKRILKKAKGE